MNDSWHLDPAKPLDDAAAARALARQDKLTKPPGSLGLLERIGVRFAAWQGTEKPALDRVRIVVFAGDHGVAEEGVSAFPQRVTAEMIANFSRGGAAISVLAKQLGADFRIVNMGTASPCADMPGVTNAAIAPGTANFRREPAMTAAQCRQALAAGRDQTGAAADLFIGGDMGIANTTAAAALGCALLGVRAGRLTGRGTGIDDATLERKTKIVDEALAAHRATAQTPFDCLRCFGGFEIAGLAGACIACAQRGIPVLIDGFIATSAALAATRLNPSTRDWMLFSHRSRENGHRLLLREMNARPLLDFGMRLGEGSGAALAVPLLRSACLLQSDMATFQESEVSR